MAELTSGSFTPRTYMNMTMTMTVLEDEVFDPYNNPDNVISFQTYLTFRKAMACGVAVALFLVGVPTNVLNCIVFYRQGLRDRMNLCLFSLALCDMMFVFFFYITFSDCLVGHFLPEVKSWWRYFASKNISSLYRGFLYSSVCVTMLIAVDRCICVLRPLKAASLIKTRSMAIMILTLVLTFEICCVLGPLRLSIKSVVDPETGRKMFFLASSEFFFQHKLLFDIVEDTFLMVTVPFVTFTVVSIATTITIIQLKRAISWRHGSSSSSSDVREKALVKMLVIVSIIFIVFLSPNIAIGLTKLLLPDFELNGRYANIYLAAHVMYVMMAMMNSSVNFFVYWARSSKFRKELYGLLPFCRLMQIHRGQGLDKYSKTLKTAVDEDTISKHAPQNSCN